jgi:hypothetical protein
MESFADKNGSRVFHTSPNRLLIFIAIDANVAASCVTGAFMEALVGPLAPEAEPDSQAAKSIAGLTARMLFRHAAPKLRLVSKGSA